MPGYQEFDEYSTLEPPSAGIKLWKVSVVLVVSMLSFISSPPETREQEEIPERIQLKFEETLRIRIEEGDTGCRAGLEYQETGTSSMFDCGGAPRNC